jgi:hypothetical protein
MESSGADIFHKAMLSFSDQVGMILREVQHTLDAH